jgi:hypothetical protein
MAIKGKKKSQKRGSQAKRRPSAPPRPTVAPKRRLAWYRTPVGFIAVLTVLALIAGAIIWAVQGAREDARALQRQQDRLEDYTGKIRAVLQTVRAPVTEMAAAPAQLQDDAQAEQLATDANGWIRQLEDAQKEMGGVVPDESVQRATSLYSQSIQIYLTAASAYKLASGTGGETQVDAIALAAQQRAQASAVWTEATGILDDRRLASDLEPSGLAAPDAAPPTGGQPVPPTIPTGPPGGGPPGGGPPGGQPDGGGAPDGGGKDG